LQVGKENRRIRSISSW